MSNAGKTNEQLLAELTEATRRIAELEAAIKQQQQSEQELKVFYQSLADALPQSIYRIDRQGRIIYGNKAYLDGLGATLDECLGKTGYDFFPKELADKYTSDDERVMETGEIFDVVESHKSPTSDEMMYVEVMKTPVRDARGEVIGVQGIFWDVTARVRAEERLEKTHVEIEKQVADRTAELKREVAERERLQQEIIEVQKQAIHELSTPVIPIMDRIIVMPLIGSIDSLRARDITRSLLAGIRERRAKVVILDITGVSVVDSGVASHLNKTIQAARLKGARTIITGVSDAVAETVIDLGIDWSGVETLADLQTGLIAALDSLGIKLTRG